MSDKPEQPRLRFGKHEHLLNTPMFQAVFERRRSLADGWVILYGRLNDLPHARLGLSVSKKFGNAVRRNRIKRIYREAFRCCKAHLPTDLDLILIPRTQEVPTPAQVMESLRQLAPALHRRLRRESPASPGTSAPPSASS